MIVIGELVIKNILGLITKIIAENISSLDFFTRRRIISKVEDTIAKVCEPLVNYLLNEGITQEKQERLFISLDSELKILFTDIKSVFRGSLNGQKIFEQFYESRKLPQTTIEDDLSDIYLLFFPRITTIICEIPVLIKDWGNNAWIEGYKRFDTLAEQINILSKKVDKILTITTDSSDELMNIFRKSMIQKIAFDLDLTGLRADKPCTGKFEDYFVHPQINEIVINKIPGTEPRILTSGNDSIKIFIQKNQKSVIYGVPGSGKSTWTKWFQQALLTSDWSGICIRFELRQLKNGNLPTIFDLIKNEASKNIAPEVNNDKIIEWIKQQKIIIIYDGFDELTTKSREEVLKDINEICLPLRGCPIIITSRPLTTNQLDRLEGNWSFWDIEKFDNKRVIEYMQRWYKFSQLLPDAERDIDIQALATKWELDKTIEPLTGNPLLLSTLLMVHHLDGNLPTGRSELYQRYISGMLGIWDDRRHVFSSLIILSTLQKKQIIQRFALLFFLNQKEQIEEEVANKWMEEILSNLNIKYFASDVLIFFIERSGLIIGPGIYSFTHKSIIEYLVAETVLSGNQMDLEMRRIDRSYLFSHCNEDQWTTVIFLWSGLAPITDIETFIEWCIEKEDFSLGYGILNDQIDRFSRSKCRDYMLNYLPERCFTSKNHFWGLSHGMQFEFTFSSGLLIPGFQLRTIGYYNTLFNLISDLIKKDILTITDINKTDGSYRDLLWMSFFLHGAWENGIKTWLTYSTNVLQSNLRVLWLCWCIDRIIKKSIKNTNLSFTKSLQECHDSIPEYSWIIPLYLLSFIGDYYFSGDSKSITDFDYLLRILIELQKYFDLKIPKTQTISTRYWCFSASDNPGSVDLLEKCIEIIHNAEKKSPPDKQDILNRSIDYIKSLIKMRPELIEYNQAHLS
ncbi:MAG: NACHT domain-containing protein [bacterium]